MDSNHSRTNHTRPCQWPFVQRVHSFIRETCTHRFVFFLTSSAVTLCIHTISGGLKNCPSPAPPGDRTQVLREWNSDALYITTEQRPNSIKQKKQRNKQRNRQGNRRYVTLTSVCSISGLVGRFCFPCHFQKEHPPPPPPPAPPPPPTHTHTATKNILIYSRTTTYHMALSFSKGNGTILLVA